MYVSNSELHLRRARTLEAQGAIDEYMKAIEAAVRELKGVRVIGRIAGLR